MNKLDVAKKIITETKLALIKFISSEKISKNNKKDLTNFIKESSSYNVLHFAAKGFFPKDKNTPIKSLLEQSVINRVILKENPKKSEIEFFAESCKEVLLNHYSKNNKVTNYILKEGSSYSLCHLAMTGKFPTDYSIEAKRNLHETIAINISNKFGRKSFISESFIHELQGNPDTVLGRFINNLPNNDTVLGR